MLRTRECIKIDSIDKKNALPLYYQLKIILREKVESGEWKPHDRIPSELELTEKFDISRATARRALSELTIEGLFYREQGRGTFVSPPKIVQGLTRFYSFSEDMRAKGLDPYSSVLSIRECFCSSSVRNRLLLAEGARVTEIRRLRLAGNEPIILETSWVPVEICPGLAEKDITETPLYEVMVRQYGVWLNRAEEYFEPVLTDEFEANLLTVPAGSPALLLSRLAYDDQDRPVELAKAIVRGDRCRYYVNLPRETED